MNLARSKKAGEPFPRLLLPTGVFLALSGAGIVPAQATCSTAGTTVTCSGVANPLAPSYANSANNVQATVNPGAGPTASDLRGDPTDGVGGHWWRRLRVADYQAHQLPDPVGAFAKPAGW